MAWNFHNRYDKDIAYNGGYKVKTSSRSDGDGYYETLKTDTRKFEELGISVKGRTQRYTVAPNQYGINKERRIGIFSQDIHKGNDISNRKAKLQGSNTYSNEVLDHYKKLGNYYKNKYGA